MTLFIPIPNWTGIVPGSALTLAVVVWLSFWLYQREQKRETDLMEKTFKAPEQVGQNGSSGQ